jgi:hypothetical protein
MAFWKCPFTTIQPKYFLYFISNYSCAGNFMQIHSHQALMMPCRIQTPFSCVDILKNVFEVGAVPSELYSDVCDLSLHPYITLLVVPLPEMSKRERLDHRIVAVRSSFVQGSVQRLISNQYRCDFYSRLVIILFVLVPLARVDFLLP